MPDTPKIKLGVRMFAGASTDPFAQLLQALNDATPACVTCGNKQKRAEHGCEICGLCKPKRSSDGA